MREGSIVGHENGVARDVSDASDRCCINRFVVCLVLYEKDGAWGVVRCSQKNICYHLSRKSDGSLTSLTFVGGIDDAKAFAVCASDTDSTTSVPNETCRRHPSYFEEEARGDVVLIASDEDGEEVDLNVEEVASILDLCLNLREKDVTCTHKTCRISG